MKDLFSAPQVVAAIIAGIFAVICKLLERSKSGKLLRPKSNGAPGVPRPVRGGLGWFAIIAAVAAVLLAFSSVGLSRKTLEAEGTFDGAGTATVDVQCARASSAIVTAYVVGTSYGKEFRSALTPQLYVNDSLVAASWSRQPVKDKLEYQVTLTALTALRKGANTIRIATASDDVHSIYVKGRYAVFAAK